MKLLVCLAFNQTDSSKLTDELMSNTETKLELKVENQQSCFKPETLIRQHNDNC